LVEKSRLKLQLAASAHEFLSDAPNCLAVIFPAFPAPDSLRVLHLGCAKCGGNKSSPRAKPLPRAEKNSARMSSTECSVGDSFYLELPGGQTWDGLETFGGCYADSGDTSSDIIVYFPGGGKTVGPVVYATTNFSPVS